MVATLVTLALALFGMYATRNTPARAARRARIEAAQRRLDRTSAIVGAYIAHGQRTQERDNRSDYIAHEGMRTAAEARARMRTTRGERLARATLAACNYGAPTPRATTRANHLSDECSESRAIH